MKQDRSRWQRQGGATRLELAVATILAAVLAGLLLDRLIAYQGETERVAVKQLISSLRTALAVRSAEVIARGEQGGLAALAEQNPMRWLQKTPANYLGEYYAAGAEGLPRASWYFDRTGQALVYLPSAHKSFSTEIQKILIFKVKLLRVPDPVEATGRREVTAGLVLDQMEDRPLAFNTSLKH
ncbi:hypothetical protein [Massilia sp. SYSU DXS3249]